MIPSRMQALVLYGIGDLRSEHMPVPEIAEGEALVQVAAVGVCGSDVPRVYSHGAYHYPLIPGHEAAGTVLQVRGSEAVAPDQRVTIKPLIPCRRCRYCEIGAFGQCENYDYIGSRRDGAMAEYVRVPTENLVPLPDGLSLLDAALTEPAAVALHALRQGGIEPGDVVAVLGTGPIGMLVAQWARIWGAGQVLLVDVDPLKLEMATALDLGSVCNARQGDPVAWAAEQTAGRGPDLVIEAAGAAATLEQALRMARPLGRVVILGNPSGAVTLPERTLSGVLRKQLTIRGTWNSQFSALPVDEWRVTVEMMAAGRLNVTPLITHQVPLAQGVQAFEMMRDRSAFYGRVVLVNELAEE